MKRSGAIYRAVDQLNGPETAVSGLQEGGQPRPALDPLHKMLAESGPFNSDDSDWYYNTNDQASFLR